MFNLRRDLQQLEPSSDYATPSPNDVFDYVVFVDDFYDGATDEQGADGAGGLLEQSAAFDLQVLV